DSAILRFIHATGELAWSFYSDAAGFNSVDTIDFIHTKALLLSKISEIRRVYCGKEIISFRISSIRGCFTWMYHFINDSRFHDFGVTNMSFNADHVYTELVSRCVDFPRFSTAGRFLQLMPHLSAGRKSADWG